MRINLTATIQHCQPSLSDLYETARLAGIGYQPIATQLEELLAEGRILVGKEMQFSWNYHIDFDLLATESRILTSNKTPW